MNISCWVLQKSLKKPKIVLPYTLVTQEQLFMMAVDKVLANGEGITNMIASARRTIRGVMTMSFFSTLHKLNHYNAMNTLLFTFLFFLHLYTKNMICEWPL